MTGKDGDDVACGADAGDLLWSELDTECGLNSYDQVEMVQRIPPGHGFGREVISKLEARIVKHFRKDVLETSPNSHEARPATDIWSPINTNRLTRDGASATTNS